MEYGTGTLKSAEYELQLNTETRRRADAQDVGRRSRTEANEKNPRAQQRMRFSTVG